MKHKIQVSKCCGASISLTGYVTYGSVCNKCNSECETLEITLTPDSEIKEVLKSKLFKGKNPINNLIKEIAKQLNINLNDSQKEAEA